MNAAQWLRNTRALCGLTQHDVRVVLGRGDGWVAAIETGRHRPYLEELRVVWLHVIGMGYRVSEPTEAMTGLRPPGDAPAPKPLLNLRADRSGGGVLLPDDASVIRGF